MIKLIPVIIALAVALPANAQEATKFASFSISNKEATVSGSYTVGGYSHEQIRGFIAKECKGAVGAIQPNGNPRKRKGKVFQKYVTTCAGGLKPKYKGSVASFEVEALPDGKTLVEIMASDGAGKMVFLKEKR